MEYLLSSKFKIGDEVYSKVDPDRKFLVTGFNFATVDESGTAINHLVYCSDGNGVTLSFYEYEIESITVEV